MEPLSLESCTVDLPRCEVHRLSQVTRLTTKEAELLAYLAARPGQPVARAELLREVWGFRGRIPNTRAPDFAVLRLRTKIERDPERPRHVITVHGSGYRFEPLDARARRDLTPLAEVPRDPLIDDDEEPTEPIRTATPQRLLPPGSPYLRGALVGRAVELRLADALLCQPGAPVVVQGPSGIGKTWLLRALVARADPDDRVAWLDLRHIDRGTLADPRRLFLRLLADLGEALNLEPEGEALPSDDARRGLTRLLEQQGLGRATGRLWLVLDHLDEARHIDDPSALCALLRAWCERTRSPWDRLRLLIGISSEPALLSSVPHLSPFNLSVPIRLSELPRADVESLAASYGLDPSEAALDQLMELTGGHPALSRAVLFRAAATPEALERVLHHALVEDGCLAAFLERRLRAMLANPALGAALITACTVGGGPVDPAAALRLESAGLLVRADGLLQPRNGLVVKLIHQLRATQVGS